MSARPTLALLALLAGIGTVAFLAQGPCSAGGPRERAALLPGFAPAEVAAVRVTRSGGEVLLSREGGAWKLGAAREAADGDAVESLLQGLAEARVEALVSTNVLKQAAYETDGEKGIAVRLEGAGGGTLAAFVIGRRGPDFASCYLRRDGEAEVLLVARDLRTDFARPADSWREPAKRPEPSGSQGPGATAPPPTRP